MPGRSLCWEELGPFRAPRRNQGAVVWRVRKGKDIPQVIEEKIVQGLTALLVRIWGFIVNSRREDTQA